MPPGTPSQGGAAQDAKNWWQRNKVEEGGGGYLGYGWDSAIWGVNVQLAALTNNSAPQWAAEARPKASQLASTGPALHAGNLQSVMQLPSCGLSTKSIRSGNQRCCSQCMATRGLRSYAQVLCTPTALPQGACAQSYMSTLLIWK